MSKRITHIILLILFATGVCLGQISPGELSSAHSKLEGMSNCTQCHDLGKKVTNSKCLECHKEIQALRDKNRGYHSHSSVKSKDCIECHSEHHGRKFELFRFDEEKFDHELAKYTLEGKHAVTDCRKCHVSENIKDPEIRKKVTTFLGLEQECLSCHDDYHQGSMKEDCTSCHNMESFAEVSSTFDHDETDFKLREKHVDVDCKKCHKVTIRDGKEFQQFKDLPHNDCNACHEDEHNSNLNGKCTQCHTERSFSAFIGERNFNHNTTRFSLKGKHKSVNCFTCHTKTSNPARVFQDHLNVGENECATCHKDVHEGKFGTNCAECHNENSFSSVQAVDHLDHSQTDYPLEGKHIEVDCKKCHTGKYTEPIDFLACKNCHEDYHRGEFEKEGVSPDCVDCHSLTEGFSYSLYTFERHQTTEFPLEGAHVATPCFACHVSEDRWTFKELGTSCTQCHENIHGEQFAKDGITDCEQCHDTESWFPGKFDHATTAFPLEGRHAEVSCDECHKSELENGYLTVNYKIGKFECIDCHQ